MTDFPDSHWQTVGDGLLKDTYDSDQAMYPAPELSYDRLKSWVDACPELCLCLQEGQTESNNNQHYKSANEGVYGLIILLPLLQSYWERLVNGDIEEHDVDASEMFPPSPDTQIQVHGSSKKVQVGLHIFHIERYHSFSSTRYGANFTTLALEEVRSRALQTFESWEVVGYSGESDDNFPVFSLTFRCWRNK